jgi:hypothetical protein
VLVRAHFVINSDVVHSSHRSFSYFVPAIEVRPNSSADTIHDQPCFHLRA